MSNDAVQTAHATVDALFEQHRGAFGRDHESYRGHVHRVLGLVAHQLDIPPAAARAVGVAAFHHDVGIWLDHTWDYLPCSTTRAVESLAPDDRHLAPLVEAIIGEHHRLRRARGDDPLAEAFRRADMADIYHPLAPVPARSRPRYAELVASYPYGRFRRMLLRAFLRGLRENPRRPMPMVKF